MRFEVRIKKKKSLTISDFFFGDPFGIQNPKYREIILKWFAL